MSTGIGMFASVVTFLSPCKMVLLIVSKIDSVYPHLVRTAHNNFLFGDNFREI